MFIKGLRRKGKFRANFIKKKQNRSTLTPLRVRTRSAALMERACVIFDLCMCLFVTSLKKLRFEIFLLHLNFLVQMSSVRSAKRPNLRKSTLSDSVSSTFVLSEGKCNL